MEQIKNTYPAIPDWLNPVQIYSISFDFLSHKLYLITIQFLSFTKNLMGEQSPRFLVKFKIFGQGLPLTENPEKSMSENMGGMR